GKCGGHCRPPVLVDGQPVARASEGSMRETRNRSARQTDGGVVEEGRQHGRCRIIAAPYGFGQTPICARRKAIAASDGTALLAGLSVVRALALRCVMRSRRRRHVSCPACRASLSMSDRGTTSPYREK